MTTSMNARPAIAVRLTPLGHGLLSLGLVMLALGWAGAENRALVAAVVLVAAPLAARRSARRSLEGVSAAIEAPEEAVERERFAVTIRLEKARGTRDALGLEASVPRLRLGGRAVFLDLLSPGGAETLRATASAGSRGEFELDGVRVETAFPLGLARASVLLPAAATVLVLPRPLATRRFLARATAADEASRRAPALAARSKAPEEDHFRALVPWQPSMPFRSIHARASARRAELLARRLEGNAEAFAAVAFDAAPPEAERRAYRARFERAVRIAAAIAYRAIREGRVLRFRIGGSATLSPRETLRLLAAVRPAPLATPSFGEAAGAAWIWISPAGRPAPPGARSDPEIEQALSAATSGGRSA